MAEKIKLVQGDTRPFIQITLRDLDGSAINLESVTTVRIYFRAAGSTTVLSTITAERQTPYMNGKILFSFRNSVTQLSILNVDPGAYEGEIELTYDNGDKQSVYDPLKFQVRKQFA